MPPPDNAEGQAMSSSSPLSQSTARSYLKELFPVSTLLTSSLPEALLFAKVAGRDFGELAGLTMEKRVELATFLASMGPWILLKGTYAPLERTGSKVIIDILTTNKGQTHKFVSEFLPLNPAVGAGCTLACILSYTPLD